MGETVDRTITESEEVSADGTHVLQWMGTTEAHSLARRQLQRCGFGDHDNLVADVIADAQVGVLKRMRSATPFPAVNPAAYGTRVIQNVVKHLVRGGVAYLEDIDEYAAPAMPQVDSGVADNLRVLLENADAPVWLTSAALAYVVLTMFPDAVPPAAPAPAAGSLPGAGAGMACSVVRW